MWVHSLCRGVLLVFWVSLFFAVNFCHCNDKTVEVVGFGECADCKENNIKTIHAFSGVGVTVDCKVKDGELKTIGMGELDEDGKFKISLPQEILKDGELKEQCFAQLRSASAAPCPAHDGLEASKITLKSKNEGKHTFGLTGKLKFSTDVCTSAFLWPYFKYPPLPKIHPFLKYFHHPFSPLPRFPPKVYPPLIYKPKPLPPPFPIYKPHFVPIYKPPFVPIYKPHVPIYKPKPKPKPPVYKFPPVPIYKPKPKPPVYRFPPVPIYKPKPKPPVYKFPPVPIYKPKPKLPVYNPRPLPPLIPIYKPKPLPRIPIYKPIYKPLPPIPKIPPFYKKPFPPIPKLLPIPKIPPKYFHHPKIGIFSPIPPYIHNP